MHYPVHIDPATFEELLVPPQSRSEEAVEWWHVGPSTRVAWIQQVQFPVLFYQKAEKNYPNGWHERIVMMGPAL
jgi:hypothetical protein